MKLRILLASAALTGCASTPDYGPCDNTWTYNGKDEVVPRIDWAEPVQAPVWYESKDDLNAELARRGSPHRDVWGFFDPKTRQPHMVRPRTHADMVCLIGHEYGHAFFVFNH